MSHFTDVRSETAGFTQDALISAAIRLFGQQGFDGTSIREIAAASGTNSASIAYHFGSKEGLRLACAKSIAGRVQDRIGPVMGAMAPAPDPDLAAQIIKQIVATMTRFMLTQKEAEDIAPFILREVSQPSEALGTIYTMAFEPVHRQLCRLWAAAAGGDAESEQTRLEVFAAIGQLLYFRIAREIVLRRMDWPAMTVEEADRIAEIITANIQALLDARRGEPS